MLRSFLLITERSSMVPVGSLGKLLNPIDPFAPRFWSPSEPPMLDVL